MGKTISRLGLSLKKTNQNNWPDPDRRQEKDILWHYTTEIDKETY